jgi:NTE family protein
LSGSVVSAVSRRGVLAQGATMAFAASSLATGVAGCSLTSDTDHDGADVPREGPLLGGVARPPRLAWVLSSGGPRGFVHVGVLKALTELKLVPDLVVGASVGSLVGVLYAAGCTAQTIERLALDLGVSDAARLALGGQGRFSGEPLADFVRQELQRAGHAKTLLETLRLPMACVAARQADRQVMAFTQGDAGLAVQASAAIEDRFTPVRIRGQRYVDADLIMPLPVRLAKRLGAVVTLAVDASAHLDRALPEGAARFREGDLRKQALTQVDATQADMVIKPYFGYYVSLSRAFREEAIAAGYQETMAMKAKLLALHGKG